MRRYWAVLLVFIIFLIGCTVRGAPTAVLPGPDAPFPSTWTPTAGSDQTPTPTLVVQPTPTWDGTPPPPSTAAIPRILPGKLQREMRFGTYTVIDLRNLSSYNEAHIDRALHIPLEELPDRMGELDGNKNIVLYDLMMTESGSLAAAMYLYNRGFTKVFVLEGGLQKWYLDGYPIEGTLLTPTPGFGPPGTVTPLPTSTAISKPTATAVLTSTVTLTPVAATGTVTPAPTPTR